MAHSSILFPMLDLPWLWIAVAYLLGALPFAVWIGKKAGKDPRKTGSKNPGASNVARTAGIRWGLFTLILDALKGTIIPSLIIGGFLITGTHSAEDTERLRWGLDLTEWATLAGIISVLGHISSPFLRFKGGRGVATALGAMFALHTGIALISTFIWLITLMLTRTPAWSSLALALSFIVFSQSVVVSDPVKIYAICVSFLIIVRHWTHIQKLLSPSNSQRPSSRKKNKSKRKKL